MGIALVIVGGIVLVTIFSVGFDYLSKKKTKISKETEQKVKDLENRVAVLESNVEERDEAIRKLENDVSFMNNLLENKK